MVRLSCVAKKAGHKIHLIGGFGASQCLSGYGLAADLFSVGYNGIMLPNPAFFASQEKALLCWSVVAIQSDAEGCCRNKYGGEFTFRCAPSTGPLLMLRKGSSISTTQRREKSISCATVVPNMVVHPEIVSSLEGDYPSMEVIL